MGKGLIWGLILLWVMALPVSYLIGRFTIARYARTHPRWWQESGAIWRITLRALPAYVVGGALIGIVVVFVIKQVQP